jgi:hypothetical protein
MSGGSFGYIQGKDGADFLADADLQEHLESMGAQLKSYGSDGQQAAAATLKVHNRVKEMRAQIALMTEELERTISPLQKVWRLADYHVSLDAGEDSVLEVLAEYNSACLATGGSSI